MTDSSDPRRPKSSRKKSSREPATIDLKATVIDDGVIAVKGAPGTSIALSTVAVLSNPLRYAFDEASKAATQFAVGDTSGPPIARDQEPGLEGTD